MAINREEQFAVTRCSRVYPSEVHRVSVRDAFVPMRLLKNSYVYGFIQRKKVAMSMFPIVDCARQGVCSFVFSSYSIS